VIWSVSVEHWYVFVNISGNIQPDGIQAVNIQSLLREKIAFLSGKFSLVVLLCTLVYLCT